MVNLLLSLNNFDENWCYSILKNIIKDNHNVLIIPFSYDDNWLKDKNDWNRAFSSEYGTHYKDIVSPFLSYGINENNIKWINQFVDSIDLMKLKIRNSDILFFTGGDQLRITSILGGTPINEAIKNLCKSKASIVGTSAGASVMSDTMIIEGKDDETPRKCTLKMSPGLGLVKNIMIDQHFAQRGRVGRLLTGIAQNPEVLGIGIDEDTAIIVSDEGIAEVVGSGAVYFVDGSSIQYSNVSEQYSNEVLSMFNVKLHVLKEGNKFNLLKKAPLEEDKNFYENDK